VSAGAALLGKDLREHGGAMAGIVLATGALVLLALAQNERAAFGISPFEVVRFALITFLPLICLVVGNRLVVREYLAGTRQFVEALPVGTLAPLLLKYLTGYLFIALLGAAVLLVCTLGASLADDPTPAYLSLLLAKTLVVLFLYWGVVFCFSLCGHLRVMLYLITLGAVLALSFLPGIDTTRFAPFALLDREFFVFERDLVPWRDMAWTAALGAAFTLAGFVIARLGDGSVAERLARPMSRRDYVMMGVLLAGGVALAGALGEKRTREPVRFTGETVLRQGRPDIELYYGAERHREAAERFLDAVSRAMTPLESRLGLESVPPIRLALRPDREAHDIDYGTLDGVFVAANWLEHDGYDDTVLVAVVLHGVLTARTGGRAPFEPYHWVLDGFTRWWAETAGGPAPGRPAPGRPTPGEPGTMLPEHRAELIARAVFVGGRLDPDQGLVSDWQGMAEAYGYPGAEALATSAMVRLQERAGSDAVMALAREFLSVPLGSSVLASLQDRRRSPEERFERATGLAFRAFMDDWRAWLLAQATVPAVAERLAAIPALQPVVQAVREDGVPIVIAGLIDRDERRSAPERTAGGGQRCWLRHSLLTPFASEWEVDDEDEREADCRADPALFTLQGRYASGDRALVAIELEDEAFHQPLRLGAARVDIP